MGKSTMKKVNLILICILVLISVSGCNKSENKDSAKNHTTTINNTTTASLTETSTELSSENPTVSTTTSAATKESSSKNDSTIKVKKQTTSTKKTSSKAVNESSSICLEFPVVTQPKASKHTTSAYRNYSITDPVPMTLTQQQKTNISSEFSEFLNYKNQVKSSSINKFEVSQVFYDENNKLVSYYYRVLCKKSESKEIYDLDFSYGPTYSSKKSYSYFCDGTDIYRYSEDSSYVKIEKSEMEAEIGATIPEIIAAIEYKGSIEASDIGSVTTTEIGSQAGEVGRYDVYEVKFECDKGLLAKQINESVANELGVKTSEVESYISNAFVTQTGKSIENNIFGWHERFERQYYYGGYKYDFFNENSASITALPESYTVEPQWYRDINK